MEEMTEAYTSEERLDETFQHTQNRAPPPTQLPRPALTVSALSSSAFERGSHVVQASLNLLS